MSFLNSLLFAAATQSSDAAQSHATQAAVESASQAAAEHHISFWFSHEIGTIVLYLCVLFVLVRAPSILRLLDHADNDRSIKALRWPIALRSFSSGLAAAYILLLLIPEASTINQQLHGSLITTYQYALLGLLIFKGIQHYILLQANKASQSMGEWKFVGVKSIERNSNFQINLAVFTVYCSLILLTTSFQFTHLSSEWARILYVVTFALHLGFDVLSIAEQDEKRFHRLAKLIVLPLLTASAMLGFFQVLPTYLLLTIFSLLIGIIIYTVFNQEIRETAKTSFVWFAGGSIVFWILNLLTSLGSASH